MKFAHAAPPRSARLLRDEVRAFLASWAGRYEPGLGMHSGPDPDFSHAVGERGWIGMTWPRAYGGAERSQVERFVVLEELLAAGAPVAAHWIADRQIGPAVLLHGTDAQRRRFLPAIAAGECFFSLGMSEPDSGSDLASVATRATPVDGGWTLDGTKIWTGQAHRNHYVLVLCRTDDPGEDRHEGLSQLIVDLAAPGVDVQAIRNLDGVHRFNRVHLRDVFVPDDQVLGQVGNGWEQVTSELAFERAGPERYLSTFGLLAAFLTERGGEPDADAQAVVGELAARLAVLRQLSLAVAAAIDDGHTPGVEAALVKEQGTEFEQELVERVRELADAQPSLESGSALERWLARAQVFAPAFTIQGGTNEVLRTVIARGLSGR